MATHPSMNDFLRQLDKWRHFPAFPLEARSEVFFALFLPTVLENSKCVGVKVKSQIIPQFPLKKEDNNQSNNVDFFALSECGKRAFLIELKTDMNSWRKEQDCYLKTASKMCMKGILEDLKEISKSRNDKHARQKYFHMVHALAELGLVLLPSGIAETMFADNSRGIYDQIENICVLRSPFLELVYVQPHEHEDDKPDDKHHYIYFDEFADCIKDEGELGKLFAGYLRKWIEDPAKHPPRRP